MRQLALELRARNLEPTRAGTIVLFIGDFLEQCRTWLNEHISLYRISQDAVEMKDMYQYVAVLLLSHLTGISFKKTTTLLQDLNCATPPLDRMRFVSMNIKGFSPTSRGDVSDISWIAQRDMTQQLDAFELICFRVTCNVFLNPVHTFTTLDDDLYGTRAGDNQMKSLSIRKADREGYTADAIADTLFRVTLIVRFRRRGEKQSHNVKHLIRNLLEGHGEHSVHGLVCTADRGYGSTALLRSLLSDNIGSIIIIPEHLLRCHPFVGKSFLLVGVNEEVGCENDAGSVAEGESDDSDGVSPSEDVGIEKNRENVVPPSAHNFDRRRTFIIEDHATAGPASYTATKSMKPLHSTSDGGGNQDASRTKVTAIAVREHGTQKHSSIHRFLYTVPNIIAKDIEAWIAVPKAEPSGDYLFIEKNEHTRQIFSAPQIYMMDKHVVERSLLQHCKVHTIRQRCDCFIIRQFRITGTAAGKILSGDKGHRAVVGQAQHAAHNELTFCEQLNSLTGSWFGLFRSTEAMMRGTANEAVLLRALSANPFVKSVFECGMMAKADMPWMACSPDGVAIIEISKLSIVGPTFTPDSDEVIGSIKIKTSIAEPTLDRALCRATLNTISCTVGDDESKRHVPKEHIGQIIQQMIVLSLNHTIYVCAAEVGLMYVAVVYYPQGVLDMCMHALKTSAEPLLSWAYEENGSVHGFGDRETKKILSHRICFW